MKIDRIVGSGTFGVVYKAVDKTESVETCVALKKIRMERETQGFPVTALREIKILKMMRHENIVQLREIITYNEGDEEHESSLTDKGLNIGDVFMVFEFVDYDLSGLMKTPKFQFTPSLIKCYMKQLLAGVYYLHENKILHRDIKSANLLITRNNVLKIADWGLARTIPNIAHKLTVPVVTLWYRSPELILGTKHYGPEIDIWSVGCIFGEMNMRVAMFRGDRELSQLELIFSLLGCPQGSILDKYKEYPDWNKLNPNKVLQPRLASKMGSFFDVAGYGLALLSKMLDLNPATRCSASEALHHEYFSQGALIRTPAE
jgi:serine/threonine protein kinase